MPNNICKKNMAFLICYELKTKRTVELLTTATLLGTHRSCAVLWAVTVFLYLETAINFNVAISKAQTVLKITFPHGC
jgi:hypothetical protein